MTTIPICIRCVRYRSDTKKLTCDAFPRGIPIEIISGEFDHKKKNHPKDNGLKFKEAKIES